MTDSHLPENWSYKLVDSQSNLPDMDLRFRRSRCGPEEDFIRSFLAKLRRKTQPDLQLTIFKEPRLETGAPDLVGVLWHLPTTERWNESRLLLERQDFRVIHQVTQTGSIGTACVQNLFGNRVAASVERLQAAGMISVDRGVISACPLDRLYAVRHIFAIEAKIRAWRMALRQAFLNRWFATTSHVLLPKMPSNSSMLSEARSLGVSVWGPDATKLTLKVPSTTSSPVSYASWLFNEWAWKVWTKSSPAYAESKYILMDQ
jgi:hypothetical protein